MMLKKSLCSFLIFFLLCLISGTLSAQSKADLEKKKQQLLKDIELTQQILKETQKNKESTLNQLVTLNKQIITRENLINTIGSQISILDRQINETNRSIDNLRKELKELKKEYAAMIVFAYRNQSNYNKLMFVFAAENFNQAYKRLKYIQQFNQYRRKQADYIIKTEKDLNMQIMELMKRKRAKNVLLLDQQKEKVELSKEKKNQEQVASSLQEKEKQLRKDLRNKQAETRRLDKAIEDIIKKEIEEARRRAEEEAKKAGKPAPVKNSSGFALTPEAQKLSNDFVNNKGKLPWPVAKGVITENFGEHEHPVLKGVMIRNNGIDIKTENGANARAVFNGEVRAVIPIGNKIAVMVSHGEYFTIYSNLKSVVVKRGDKVSTKQVLGSIINDEKENQTEVHLEIWKGSVKLDPADWLAN